MAHFLINLILAILFGWFAYYLLLRGKVDSTPALLLGVLVGLVVFLLNPAAHL